MIHPAEPSRLKLAQLPTPIVPLDNLAKHLNLPVIPLLKRDDLTGLETSGNKIRKLEYVIADALAKSADTLITHGGFQSNHCRATAAIAARLGLRCRLLLRAPENPANEGNLFLDRLFGAEISLHSPAEFASNKKGLIDSAMQAEVAAGHAPYFFPVGASVPLGSWGYIRCIRELLDSLGTERAIDVYAPVSSSGTIAGLILGAAMFRPHDLRIIGIPVSDSVAFFNADIRKLIDDTIADYRLNLTAAETPIELMDGFIGEGYAMPTPQSLETLRLLARTQGIATDPTYTAKAFAGFLDAILKHKVRPNAAPLFIHTGGLFGLFARRDLF